MRKVTFNPQPSAAFGQKIHVAKNGDDSNSGSAEQPLLTVVRAAQAESTLPDGNGSPGTTSGKRYSVSDDNGKSWSKPQLLRYDDGKAAWPPRSYLDIFVSRKNGRLYCVLNVADALCRNYDSRNVLYIAEIDPNIQMLKRKTLTPIEAMHPEHHPLVRFSNWQQVEDGNDNLLLFTTFGTSENCPIRRGYDRLSYVRIRNHFARVKER